MVKMYVRHTVADFAKWKTIFDEHDATRKSFGAKKSEVFTNSENPNEIIALINWDNKGQAIDFMEKSDLKAIMENGGVLTAPEINFAE
jgi:hypothetical protein